MGADLVVQAERGWGGGRPGRGRGQGPQAGCDSALWGARGWKGPVGLCEGASASPPAHLPPHLPRRPQRRVSSLQRENAL